MSIHTACRARVLAAFAFPVQRREAVCAQHLVTLIAVTRHRLVRAVRAHHTKHVILCWHSHDIIDLRAAQQGLGLPPAAEREGV